MDSPAAATPLYIIHILTLTHDVQVYRLELQQGDEESRLEEDVGEEV